VAQHGLRRVVRRFLTRCADVIAAARSSNAPTLPINPASRGAAGLRNRLDARASDHYVAVN
jgi:hypothetical protein